MESEAGQSYCPVELADSLMRGMSQFHQGSAGRRFPLFLLPHQRMLPKIQRFPIDAHGSDVTQLHPIDLPVSD